MELTSRQIEFVEKLIDLYAEVEDNIHYSKVAERLGVSRSTAYEMLRLLERKGFARAHYYLDESGGPGRSTVLFSPTERAHAIFKRMREQVGSTAWETVRTAIILAVLSGAVADRDSVAEVLNALGRDDQALSLCTQVVTGALLLCSELANTAPGLWESFMAVLQSDSGLVLLPGMVLTRIVDVEERAKILTRWKDYQQSLVALEPERRDELLRLAREMAGLMRLPPRTPQANHAEPQGRGPAGE